MKRDPKKKRSKGRAKGIVKYATKMVEEGITNYLDDAKNEYYENTRICGKIERMGKIGKRDDGTIFLPFDIYTRFEYRDEIRRKWWGCWAYRKLAILIKDEYEVGDWIRITRSAVSIYHPTPLQIEKYKAKPKLQLYVQRILPKWNTELSPDVSLELMKVGKIRPSEIETIEDVPIHPPR